MSLSESQSQFSAETGDRAGEVTYDRKSIVSWLSIVKPSSPREVSPMSLDAEDIDCYRGNNSIGPETELNPVIALIAATPPFQFHTLEDFEDLPTSVSTAVTHMSAIREDPIPSGLKVRC